MLTIIYYVKNRLYKNSVGKCVLFSFFVLFQYLSFSQNILKGKITDNKNHSALAGASVYIPDIKIGSVSKADGSYEIKDIETGTYLIEVSYIGYAPQYKEIRFSG